MQDESTVKIQKRLLQIAKEAVAILERHDIPYSMAYGTMLGAIRHKGFIPWDEDLDLWLFGDSYDLAMEYLRSELPKGYFLEDEKSEPNYFHAWSHVKDLNSISYSQGYPHDNSYAHKGLSLDLYRLNRVKECDLFQHLCDENKKYIERRRKLGLMSDEEYRQRIQALQETVKSEMYGREDSDQEVYALLNPYKCKFLRLQDVHPLKKYPFEDTEFYGVCHADKILTDVYGDYMTPPPVEKRKKGHSSVVFLDE